MQQEFFITIDGNDRKISAKGKFYGWPVNRYTRVMDWAPSVWLESSRDWSATKAKELILEEGLANAEGVILQDLAKKLFSRRMAT